MKNTCSEPVCLATTATNYSYCLLFVGFSEMFKSKHNVTAAQNTLLVTIPSEIVIFIPAKLEIKKSYYVDFNEGRKYIWMLPFASKYVVGCA